MKEVILWAIHNGYKHLGFNVCKELGRAENSDILLNFKEKVETYYLLNMLNEEYGEQISIKYGSFYSYFHTLERMTHTKNENVCDTLLPCKAGTESCAILYDGYVVPCNSLSKTQSSCECNILEHSLKQIWESSESFIKWRELLNIKVSDVCEQCSLNLICTGGCRAQALIENDNLFNVDRDICLAYQLGYR